MRDVNYNKGIYENWKAYALKNGMEGISKESSKIIMQYLFDLEQGKNLGRGSRKGARSYSRLNSYRHKLTKFAKLIEAKRKKSIIKADVDTIHSIISSLKQNHSQASITSYGREFKAFWNWYIRTQRLKDKEVKDICWDLETAPPKTRFVYVTKEQVDKMLPYLDYDEQLLTKFIFDTIIRSPKEVLNLRGQDIYERDGEVWVNIPDEISKTFGRTFNLLYTGEEILKHIKKNKIGDDDFLFMSIKKYKTHYIPKLRQVATQLFGNKVSHPKAQKMYSELSPYDLRHSGAIFLRILAQKNNSISLDAIRQRGGWSDFTMLTYYTELIGLTGEIKKESLLIEEDKTKLEKEVAGMRNQLDRFKDVLLVLAKSSRIKDEDEPTITIKDKKGKEHKLIVDEALSNFANK